MDIPVQRAEVFFTPKEYSQVDPVATGPGVKAKLFHRLNSGRGGKVRKEVRLVLGDGPVLRALTSAAEEHSSHPFFQSS